MPPHGIDYWFMMPVSNPDNTVQELHLSLAVTDVRSNCSSTTISKAKELWRPTKPPQPVGHTLCRHMPGTFRDSGPSSLNRTTTLPGSEGVQEDDKTSTVPLYQDKPRAHTHMPGSHKTWGTQLKRHSGIGAGPPHLASIQTTLVT
ncbi:hypothetical protein Taro_044847 [Colocasia esculenta]|uniref:Uncharacterized protein n=1 Tax=Colocasia esculenta TaxID=4460 RepID=A0A843X3C8_COLES|nr:hypothetical protein [Colocasia esculenta]